MKKNNFFEKFGKFIFSLLITSFLVVWLVWATTTWRDLTNNDTISGTNWKNMVDEIDSKISVVDLSDYYTKSESNNNFTSNSVALNNVISKCEVCLWWADNSKTSPTKSTCSGFNEWFKFINTDGKVDGNDNFFIKVVCNTGSWSNWVYSKTYSNCMPEQWGNKKSWDCNIWDTYKYYTWWSMSWCPIMKGSWDPMMKWQKEYIQTCK